MKKSNISTEGGSAFGGKKNYILIFALLFTAVSCNSLFSGSNGSKGVFRSDDLGKSFTQANTIDKKTNLATTSVNNLLFDPSDTQKLYLASAAGLYKTENRGENWKLLVTNILAADAAVDSQNGSNIYVVGSSEGHGKIIKTTDAGGSWQDLYTEPTKSNTVVSVAIDPSNHDHILACLKSGEIIHSLDTGNTWQVITDLHDDIYKLRFGPNNLPYILTYNNGLYESKDGAKTFVNLTGTLTGSLTYLNSDFSSVSRFLDLSFDNRQPGVIYLATNAGLVRTVNDGGAWNFMRMPLRNSVLRTSSIAVNPKDSNNLFAVVGTTLFESSNGGITWETKPLTTTQEVRQILIDFSSPNVIYLSLGVKK